MSRARNVRGDRHALTRALHPFALIVLFACGPFEQLGHLSPRIFGQERSAPSLAELDAKLAAARAELAAERGRLESLRAEWEREASELEAKLDDASREIVRAAIERESLRVEGEDLTRRLPAIGSARRSLVAAVRSALAALATTAEELGLQADETPGLHGFAAELRKIARNLGAPEPDPSSLASVARLAEIADEIHRRGTGVEVREARLLTARGVEEDVELLAVGALSFAYRTRPDGRIGFALSSPADARGFRFSEELSSDARRSIEEAIAALVNDPASREPVLAPIDATGTIAAPALAGDQGLLAMLIAGGPV
ncbi:MAG TPA: hypothetical protein VK116_02810, partial [Planctomycetota bacterium]|nr:hypothetical protein [Planctomycetota bacterium]